MQRLLILADHASVAEAVQLALRQTSGFRVVGCVDGREPVRAALADLLPDVVIVDDMADGEFAHARLRELAAELPTARAVLLTAEMDRQRVDDAFAAGAHAVLCKTVHPVSLGTLLREICHGNVALRHRAGAPVLPVDCRLTNRELEILKLVAEGYTNGRIARQLWVTEQTVKFHLSNTYRKLGVRNRTEASRYAHLHALAS